MVVYKITNLLNGKVYIGQTIQLPKKRWNCHVSNSKKKSISYINSAILKYGKENFTFDIIDTALSIQELNEKEIFWINKYDSINIGYNLKQGGRNASHSLATLEKIANKSRGRKHSIEVIEKIRKSHIGSKRSNESKNRMSIAAKNSEAKKIHLETMSHGRKKIIDQNGTVYNSISQASKILNIARWNIHQVLTGEFNQIKGYKFTYMERN